MNQPLEALGSDGAMTQPLWLAPSLLIAHSLTGLPPGPVLPATEHCAAYPLNFADLTRLQALTAGEPCPLEGSELFEALRQRGLLLDNAAEGRALPAAEPNSPGEYPAGEALLLVRPLALRLDAAGYSYLSHDGLRLLTLDAGELCALGAFTSARTADEACEHQRELLGDNSLEPSAFDRLLQRAHGAGLLANARDRASVEDFNKRQFAEGIRLNKKRREFISDWLQEEQAREDQRALETGLRRIKVIPVHTEPQPLLSLGLLMSYAMAYDDSRLCRHYEFVRDWGNITVPRLSGDEAPAIFLFSNYLWSHSANMALSQQAKDKNPRGLCIHGGPDTPKYPGDVKRYLELNPHIDVIVHGEGEQTIAHLLDTLREPMAEGSPDLRILDSVAGITYRIGDTFFTTEARDRLADLDVIPSPYRNGLFDNIGDLPMAMQTIETNRGCPFGCTFCDWGSATLTKIRKFDLDRVYDDLEWCAKNKVRTVFNTDANFGVFERDVDIARKVVELKEKYGYPRVFESSYAKNQVKHLKKIIDILAAGGVVSTGTLSLQSVSPDTLTAIRRSNIKVSKYDELAVQFNESKLPLIVEMMMGLPGSTVESFEADLQQAIDREVHARVNPTEVLVNSPMNDPEYREEFDLQLQRPLEDDWKVENGRNAPEKALIVASSTFDRSQYQQMDRWRRLFLLLENFGVLRQIARYVRHETGILEMRFYHRLEQRVREQPLRWPTLSFCFNSMKDLMAPPGSWKLLIEEVRDYLVTELNIPDDSALETVLQVQHALLPARDRDSSLALSLPHDYARWHHLMVRSKKSGWEQDWTPDVPALREMLPATFPVKDAQKLGNLGLGTPLLADQDLDWEFDSPIGRALRYRRSAELT